MQGESNNVSPLLLGYKGERKPSLKGEKINPGLTTWQFLNFSILCLSGCLFVCLYPINFKTAESIGPKFCLGLYMSPKKVYGWSKFQNFASNKIRCSLNFKHQRHFFNKIHKLFCFCFIMHTQRKCSQLKQKRLKSRII